MLLHDQYHPVPIYLTCLQRTTHIVVEMKHMVDGYGLGNGGGEYEAKIPSREWRERSMIP
jgi:hypothetical protein